MLAIIKTYSDYRREKDELGKRFLFLIDEAELHLHPTAQRQLKIALARLAENGDQVFINTHSSVLVTDDMVGQCLWKVRKDGMATRISAIAPDDKPEVVYELLGGSPADLLFPNNFLIVEGRSEEVLLRRVMQRFYGAQPRVKVVFAGGDFDAQEKSMAAINTAFTPLNQTPVYRNKLILLCDKPNERRAADFTKFCDGYKHLQAQGQLVVSLCCTLEESYPAPWKNSVEEAAKLSARQKTDLAEVVGNKISKEQFEADMGHMFRALQTAWEKAYK